VEVNPAEYFDYEIVCFGADTSPRFPVKVVEETEEYIIHTTPYGGLYRDHKDYSTTPEKLDNPCKSWEDWAGNQCLRQDEVSGGGDFQDGKEHESRASSPATPLR
jgi:hypothetical protein